uniref:Retrotransposon gag domain-containing protein n=1 Tax=Brassica campestris TaxID=3711 RepID=M4FH84_BRACM
MSISKNIQIPRIASIASFAILSDNFVEQFASSRDLEKTSVGLYEILQHRAEPLRGYIACFNQEKLAIPECTIPTAIYAFKRGLLPCGENDKPGIPGTEARADTRTGRTRRQKGWQCPRGETSLTSPYQGCGN